VIAIQPCLLKSCPSSIRQQILVQALSTDAGLVTKDWILSGDTVFGTSITMTSFIFCCAPTGPVVLALLWRRLRPVLSLRWCMMLRIGSGLVRALKAEGRNEPTPRIAPFSCERRATFTE